MTSLACCALGAWLRVDYALFHHHLRHRASSDALLYLERAQELLQRGAVPNLPATIWPPGTSALWAVLSAVDPAQQLTAAWSAAASILVMPLTAAIAGLLAGPRAAWIALAIAALHPGFIHYAGFALAEQPFQLAIAVAMYLTLSALVRLEAEPPAAGVAPPLARATSAAPRAAVSGDAVVGENAAASSSAASTSSAPNVVRASASPSAPNAVHASASPSPSPRPDPTPTGHYIRAEVVTPNDARSEGRRGKLGPASPGGGSA
ncbi:MAG TPA: phospholipid carrier-dependent glycosyltransferase, partial [Polyangiales bacterium]|nr:phospholipid carrier-dependent glycosyltransferase [Polyangiales bacterium]